MQIEGNLVNDFAFVNVTTDIINHWVLPFFVDVFPILCYISNLL